MHAVCLEGRIVSAARLTMALWCPHGHVMLTSPYPGTYAKHFKLCIADALFQELQIMDPKLHLVLRQEALCLVASPAALNPDGCSFGLQELHSALPASEASLQLDNCPACCQEAAALVCTPCHGLNPHNCHLQTCLCSAP